MIILRAIAPRMIIDDRLILRASEIQALSFFLTNLSKEDVLSGPDCLLPHLPSGRGAEPWPASLAVQCGTVYGGIRGLRRVIATKPSS